MCLLLRKYLKVGKTKSNYKKVEYSEMERLKIRTEFSTLRTLIFSISVFSLNTPFSVSKLTGCNPNN